MVDLTPIKCETFEDIYKIVEARSKVAGTIQDRDRNLIKGFVNEWYQTIATERNWKFRKFDRSFVFDKAITTGTISVTEDSRVVTFTGLTLKEEHLGRSIKVDETEELYRIVGINTSLNQVYLDTYYVGDTDATATYKLYNYEHALPPDCDVLNQLNVSQLYSGQGEIEGISNEEFNRVLYKYGFSSGYPELYTEDGKVINPNSGLYVLDEMVLDYDFLAGELTSDHEIKKIRLLPIEPDKKITININYSKHVVPMVNDDDKPLIERDDRWVLVHMSLGSWHMHNGSNTLAGSEFAIGKGILKDMRAEHKKTESSPKFKVDARRYKRISSLDNYRDEFYRSRELEY